MRGFLGKYIKFMPTKCPIHAYVLSYFNLSFPEKKPMFWGKGRMFSGKYPLKRLRDRNLREKQAFKSSKIEIFANRKLYA